MILGIAWYHLILACLAMAVGGIVQATIGLGFALAAIPLIALIDTSFIPGPIMVAGMVMVVLMAIRGRASISPGEIAMGVGGLVVGTVIGAIGLWLIPSAWSRPVFGALILLAVLVSVFAPPVRLTRPRLLVAGTASGIMGTMVGLHGPPLGLVYQNEEPARARIMLSTFFIPATLISVAALAILGRFGLREILLGLLLIPGPLLGLAVAPLVGRYLDRLRTRWAILLVAGVSGALLFV